MGNRDGVDLEEVIKTLLRYYGRVDIKKFLAIRAKMMGLSPFGVIVSIILTQNTSDVNALKALSNLIDVLGRRLDPDSFRKITEEELAKLIKPSGMQRIKARAIMNLLKNDELVNSLDSLDPSTLRNKLVNIKGIGPKTADVFLLMFRNYPTFPIDTHIRRILYRLGFIHRNSSYESIRKIVMDKLSSDMYLPAHLILIHHGRTICFSRKPKCHICPIRRYCKKVGVT